MIRRLDEREVVVVLILFSDVDGTGTRWRSYKVASYQGSSTSTPLRSRFQHSYNKATNMADPGETLLIALQAGVIFGRESLSVWQVTDCVKQKEDFSSFAVFILFILFLL